MTATVRFVPVAAVSLAVGLLSARGVHAQDVRADQQASGGLEEIVVTATRREEPLSRVPISVTAFTQEQMDVRGLNKVDDLFRETPGVTFTPSAFANTTSIDIRGIAGSTGAATTGIYIDDTPIQVRVTGISFNTNFYPALVDLARVEVLRGPQGTLFGAGAEGGAVRFITREPDLQSPTVYIKNDTGYTEHGGVTYETAVAGSVPLIPGRLAVSASASYRHDGGWVDVVDSNGQVTQSNANWNETKTARLALKFAATDWLTLTPSLFYQSVHRNDSDNYWPSLSDPSAGAYVDADKWPTSYRGNFSLPALKVVADLGAVQLTSNTSYFDGVDHAASDYSAYVPTLLGLIANPVGTRIVLTNSAGQQVLPDYLNPVFVSSEHKFFTQEIRAQSASADSRITWVAGAFFSHSDETSGPFLDTSGYLPGEWQQLLTAVGPANAQYYTAPLVDGRYSYDGINKSREQQIALFADATWEFVPRWKVNAGFRYAKNEYSFFQSATGPFAGGAASGGGSESEKPLTPKFGLSYQVNDANMLYLSAAKGFRTGGANYALPSACQSEATQLGLTNADRYQSDSVWSYELGAKNHLFNNRLSINSSAYFINWEDIQQAVGLNCGFGLTLNLGQARSKGFDVQTQLALTDSITLGATVAYTDAYYSKTLFAPGTNTDSIVREGDALPSTPWMFMGSGQYRFMLLDHSAYLRADYTYTGRAPLTPDLDSQNSSAVYNPYGLRIPGYGLLDLRAGMVFGNWNVSLYAKNATNSAALLAVNRQGVINDFVDRNLGLQPLTAGVQAIFRY